jgi:hypothetical protein
MTGSGKTGLCIGLLEEAALDKIPAILIDPKGDLGNLLLTFPDLTPQEFLPWIDPAEAERKGMNPKQFAEVVAKTWKDGLEQWGEKPERIKKLRESVEMCIYTPASKAGIPLSILTSFAPPPKEQMLDTETIRDRILSITSGVLGLIGISADPIKSREHILISTLINHAWQKGTQLDIATLIQQVQKPPFNKIGALDLETFYPQKDRLTLSISLNNLLASPGFQAWMEGDPIDIQQLLYTKEGKPKLSIVSIAHLSDSERMFFVTLLLNEIILWMRRQPGTSSLRALLYMDEIYGYFPPIAMPPSKIPMITLLKQARAYGIGIVLTTQNPVDLDYKGLSNCGTWFIGKLQTDRDKARVIEGLKVASTGELDAAKLDKLLASTGNRTFILNSIYEKKPILFQTRWTMSYLRGPLTLAQIAILTEKSVSPLQTAPEKSITKEEGVTLTTKPMVPPSIPEFFLRNPSILFQQGIHYKPKVAGTAKLHFVDAKNKIDVWQDLFMILPPSEDGTTIPWEEGTNKPALKNNLEKSPLPDSTFDELPAGLMQEKNYANFEKTLSASLYQNQTLNIFKAVDLNATSKVNETEGDFRARMLLVMREKRDEAIEDLRNRYAEKIITLTDKIRRAQEKMTKKQQDAWLQKTETWISFGATILAALFGRKVTRETISQTGTSLRRAGRMSKGSQDAAQAEQDYKVFQQQLADLQDELKREIDKISTVIDASKINVETIAIRPRKGDISIEEIALVWSP